MFHYRPYDMNIMTSQTLALWLFVQQFDQANKKKNNTKAPHYRPFVRGIHW